MKHLIGHGIQAPCPECDGQLVVRQNQTTHVYFIGCSAWPDCTYTAKLPESLRMELLEQPALFPLDYETSAEPIPGLKIRSLLDRETDSPPTLDAVRLCGMCDDQAWYVATIGNQHHYLCRRHKLEIEQAGVEDGEEEE